MEEKMPTTGKPAKRSSCGNMLVIACAVGFVILLVALWVIDLMWLHFINKKELTAAEKVAMAAAVALNRDDSIGQMNYMLSHSRELICCLRYNETVATEKQYTQLEKITKALAQKAHDTSAALARQQSKLESYRIEQAIDAAKAAIASSGSPGAAHMGGIATSGVSLVEDKCSFGCLRYKSETDSDDQIAPSNIEPSKYLIDEKIDKLLLEYDKKFIDEKAGFYKASPALDLNFPGGGDDQDLVFQLSSLPPCIDNYISPPRLLQANEYHYLGAFKKGVLPRFTPSAVQIVLKLDIKDTQGGATNQLMAPGIAVCGGAAAPP